MFLGKDHLVKKNICSVCGHDLDGATQINGDNKPKPGDVSICVGCANIAIFDDDLNLRQPDLDEEQELLKDQTIAEAQTKILLYLKVRELKLKYGFGYGNS